MSEYEHKNLIFVIENEIFWLGGTGFKSVTSCLKDITGRIFTTFQ